MILTTMTKTAVGWLVTLVHAVGQRVRRICFRIRFGRWRGWLFVVGWLIGRPVDWSVDWPADWCIMAFGEVVIVGRLRTNKLEQAINK